MKRAIKAAFPFTVPVLTGYLFLGFAYGVFMRNAGFSVWITLLMSVFVYAGSMQYAAVPLLGAPFAPVSTFLLALLVNARHIFYGISLLGRYRGTGAKEPYLVFSMTDETFSVNISACVPPGIEKGDFYASVSLLHHFYWALASVLGNVCGGMLSLNLKGIEFVMTALFAVIFTGQWQQTKEHRPALLGVGISALCLWLFGPSGFILPSMLLILAVLLCLRGTLCAEDITQSPAQAEVTHTS